MYVEKSWGEAGEKWGKTKKNKQYMGRLLFFFGDQILHVIIGSDIALSEPLTNLIVCHDTLSIKTLPESVEHLNWVAALEPVSSCFGSSQFP